ncbi:aldehyde dehydrogenase family protein [Natranaerobius thermophilus JW/NM-WN-LF]|nr:aldehyde dehydrogenase family protein [Natranaerobius thermophilus]
MLSDIQGLPSDLVQVVQGPGIVGQKIVSAKPDMIFFTGSVNTGKKVKAAASEQLIPVELELGGKDPMIVLEDANLERAAEGAVYGGFANTGQLCVSTERLYVQETIANKFLEIIKEKTERTKSNQGD